MSDTIDGGWGADGSSTIVVEITIRPGCLADDLNDGARELMRAALKLHALALEVDEWGPMYPGAPLGEA